MLDVYETRKNNGKGSNGQHHFIYIYKVFDYHLAKENNFAFFFYRTIES